MKKFEIINGWIKQIDFQHELPLIAHAIKIKSINLLSAFPIDENLIISLSASTGHGLNLTYVPQESEQFKSDLTFFEKLLYEEIK